LSVAPPTRERVRDLDAEQEIDLGRVVGAVVRRWWLLVVGLVAGAIIGLLVSLGGGRQWAATAEIYLGEPLSPSSSPISGVPTSLGLAAYLATTEDTIRKAAAQVGLKPGQLRGEVSSSPILGLTGQRLGSAAPLVTITVRGSSPLKVALASNAIADIVIRRFGRYTNQKLSTLEAALVRDKTQLKQLQARVTAAVAQQQALASARGVGSTDKLVSISALNSVISTGTAEMLSLQADQTQELQLISEVRNVEAPGVVSPAAAVSLGGPSRRSAVVIGAIAGFVLGLLAAALWDPIAAHVRPQTT
jgi:Chain length determinant protein